MLTLFLRNRFSCLVQLGGFLLSAAMHLAGAYVHSYGAMMTVRVFQGYFPLLSHRSFDH